MVDGCFLLIGLFVGGIIGGVVVFFFVFFLGKQLCEKMKINYDFFEEMIKCLKLDGFVLKDQLIKVVKESIDVIKDVSGEF